MTARNDEADTSEAKPASTITMKQVASEGWSSKKLLPMAAVALQCESGAVADIVGCSSGRSNHPSKMQEPRSPGSLSPVLLDGRWFSA